MSGTPTQQLITSIQTRLGGSANALTSDQFLDFVNEAKDEFWSVLVTCANDYFVQNTTTTVSQSNTFAALNTTTREYTLPSDYLCARFIEVLSPSGYENTRFVFRDLSHPEFQAQRRDSTASGNSSGALRDVYYYTIVGKNTFMLAAYPEVAFTLKIWYVRAIADLVLAGTFDETVLPFPKKIVDYAVSRIRFVKDPGEWAAWKQAWKDDVVTLLEAATPRSSTDAQFAAEFCDGGF
jgi:hypothetical protein